MTKPCPLTPRFIPCDLPLTARESHARRCIVQSVVGEVTRDGGKVPQPLLVLLERYVKGELEFVSSRDTSRAPQKEAARPTCNALSGAKAPSRQR